MDGFFNEKERKANNSPIKFETHQLKVGTHSIEKKMAWLASILFAFDWDDNEWGVRLKCDMPFY